MGGAGGGSAPDLTGHNNIDLIYSARGGAPDGPLDDAAVAAVSNPLSDELAPRIV